MSPSKRNLKRDLLVLAPVCLVPLEVSRIAHLPAEGAFGNGLAIAWVTILGGLVALGYGCVAFWIHRTRRGHLGVWLAGALIALSPALYYVLWNLFFRADQG